MELQKTNQQNTSTALWKDSNAATVSLLRAGQFDELSRSVPNKVSAILECEPITSVISHVGEQTVKMYVEAEIIKLGANVNINPALNLKDFQVPVIAEHLIENYKWESIEDFTLCFRKGACGMYGEIYRLDAAVIGQWMSRYLEEKYDALEQRKAKWKHNPKNEERSKDVVDGSKYIKQMLDEWGVPQKNEPNNAKENEYQRGKLDYMPPSEDHVRKSELHTQYLRENYDPISGKKKDTWIPEEQWLALLTQK